MTATGRKVVDKRDVMWLNEGMEETTQTSEQRGATDYASGHDRIVPREILVAAGVEAAKAWYRGWDRANLAAPWSEEL